MLRWLPWKFFVKHAARRYGVLDPATFLARMRRFSQPSEVAEPLELARLEHGEILAIERGANGRVFESTALAERWLRHGGE